VGREGRGPEAHVARNAYVPLPHLPIASALKKPTELRAAN